MKKIDADKVVDSMKSAGSFVVKEVAEDLEPKNLPYTGAGAVAGLVVGGILSSTLLGFGAAIAVPWYLKKKRDSK